MLFIHTLASLWFQFSNPGIDTSGPDQIVTANATECMQYDKVKEFGNWKKNIEILNTLYVVVKHSRFYVREKFFLILTEFCAWFKTVSDILDLFRQNFPLQDD